MSGGVKILTDPLAASSTFFRNFGDGREGGREGQREREGGREGQGEGAPCNNVAFIHRRNPQKKKDEQQREDK